MKTLLSQAGDVIVVKVSGRLEIEKSLSFRKACLERLTDKKIIFQLDELTFVGSTGIQSFFQVVQELHNLSPQKVKVVGLPQDFSRIYQINIENKAPCLSQISEALNSFQNPAT